MSLFQIGVFTLHSGEKSNFKIDCDALTNEDIMTCAALLAERIPPYNGILGIPRGGIRLANAMIKFQSHNPDDPILICDDVYTTGTSFKEFVSANSQDKIGVVLFARNNVVEDWIYPLFQMGARIG